MTACASTPNHAPVIDSSQPTNNQRVSEKANATATPPVNKSTEKDWRPETYTVKKGDTLYAIGLQYGYDYKEIAQLNGIAPPYSIKIGQVLKLQDNKESIQNTSSKNTDEGTTTTPLKTGEAVTGTPNGLSPTLSEPKALREPYSEQAMTAKPAPVQTNTSVTNNNTANTSGSDASKSVAAQPPKANEKTDISKVTDEAIDWGWPVTGKVITNYNDTTSAKGIDIAGTMGQTITAAAAGNVIYSGSDLRGYGKLIIIKHNKNYLSVYAHNNQILVKEGQFVSKGQKIAEMGNSDADRYKLHFEVRQQGKSVDPLKVLPNN